MQHHSSVSVDVTDEYSVVMDFMIDGCVFFFQAGLSLLPFRWMIDVSEYCVSLQLCA